MNQSWPRICSRVHLHFAVRIFQFFIFVVFSDDQGRQRRETLGTGCIFFLAVCKILGQPCRCFGVFSLASSPFLAIVIRRLLYVPDYAVG